MHKSWLSIAVIAVALVALLALLPRERSDLSSPEDTGFLWDGLYLGKHSFAEVPYVSTPYEVVDEMIRLAGVTADDVVYDLGCGNGIIVVTAAKKYGVKAVGFDINPERIKESLENVRANKVEHLVTIKQADIFTLDLSEASVVTLYLLPSLNVKLMPQLAKLKPGSRIVSHDFDMRGAKPVEVATVSTDSGQYLGTEHTVYKWVVPWEKEEAP